MVRLDIGLVNRAICRSRAQAQLAIKEGNVLLNGGICLKPNKDIKESDSLSLVNALRYVSRGGDKLAAAIDFFEVGDLEGKIALDIGSSTGGFTDCLLQNNVFKVYAVDVGTSQIDSGISSDTRVTVMEKTDIRSIKNLPDRVDIIVIDVSFISLEHIIPILNNFIKTDGQVIALVKPQFEVGRGNLNRQGLVTDKSLYKVVLDRTKKLLLDSGFKVKGSIVSPIIGGTGNTEFLIHAVKDS